MMFQSHFINERDARWTHGFKALLREIRKLPDARWFSSSCRNEKIPDVHIFSKLQL